MTSQELRVYTAREAAAVLKCKASWLKEQARRRQIPFTMIGGSYHFTAAHVAEIAAIFEVRPRTETGPRPHPSRARAGQPGSITEPTDPGREPARLVARPPRAYRGPPAPGGLARCHLRREYDKHLAPRQSRTGGALLFF